MAGCGVVFHSAAEVAPWARSWKRHEQINVQGEQTTKRYPLFLGGTLWVHLSASGGVKKKLALPSSLGMGCKCKAAAISWSLL